MGMTQVQKVRSAGKNVPSRLLKVVLLHKVFPCPVCDPLDTRCLLSFKTLLPPSLFVLFVRRNTILLMRSEGFLFFSLQPIFVRG